MTVRDRRCRPAKSQMARPPGSRPVAIMPPVRATILAVGSELLSTERLDTNSLRLTALLERFGVELAKKSVIGDLEGEIQRELEALWATSDLVLVSGGLGPTNNRKQAQVLVGAEVLENPKGTAPGQLFERDGKALFLFPGVPFELDGMAADALVPWLERKTGGAARETWTIKVAMRPESEVDLALAPAYAEFGQEWMTVLAGAGEVRVLLTAVGGESARRERLAVMRARTLELLGDSVFGEGAETTLEGVVARLLADGGWTLATAESCTGGLVAERMTRVPGVSAVFVGGVVAYSNELKSALLDVAPELLARCGAVSEEVARAMATGVCRRLGSAVGVSLTGIAGPGGGSPEKPVGTVHVAVAGPGDGEVEHRVARFPGSRERIRMFAAQMALEMLRRRLTAAMPAEGAGAAS